MAFSLTWLSQVLQDAGLKVSECDGWQDRGVAEMGNVVGVLCHHTATLTTKFNMPTLNTLINGRADPPLSGPLSQLGLGRDGTYYIVAAGKCNHAGKGSWLGIQDNTGNSHFIGIEAENTGTPANPWPDIQMDAYHRGVAAILMHIGQPVGNCVGHKEYAPARKVDPDFDMDAFRNSVSTFMTQAPPAPTLIPAAEPGGQQRPTLRRGLSNNPDLVKIVQTAVGVNADGIFGGGTEAAVRQFQSGNNLVPDGIVGPKTWALIGE